MLFVGVALLVAVGLALLVSADAGSLLGLTQMQFGQLIPLVILAIVFAAGAFSRRQKFSSIVANFATWAGLFVVVMIGYAYREDLKDIAARVLGELSPTTAIVDSENGTATFRRGLDGHFTVGSTVNGASIPLLFDTGASAVVLSYRDAQRAGIPVDDLSFTLPCDDRKWHRQGGARPARPRRDWGYCPPRCTGIRC
jgi:aspartyl protease family protein